jgi:hypothetical protein
MCNHLAFLRKLCVKRTSALLFTQGKKRKYVRQVITSSDEVSSSHSGKSTEEENCDDGDGRADVGGDKRGQRDEHDTSEQKSSSENASFWQGGDDDPGDVSFGDSGDYDLNALKPWDCELSSRAVLSVSSEHKTQCVDTYHLRKPTYSMIRGDRGLTHMFVNDTHVVRTDHEPHALLRHTVVVSGSTCRDIRDVLPSAIEELFSCSQCGDFANRAADATTSLDHFFLSDEVFLHEYAPLDPSAVAQPSSMDAACHHVRDFVFKHQNRARASGVDNTILVGAIIAQFEIAYKEWVRVLAQKLPDQSVATQHYNTAWEPTFLYAGSGSSRFFAVPRSPDSRSTDWGIVKARATDTYKIGDTDLSTETINLSQTFNVCVSCSSLYCTHCAHLLSIDGVRAKKKVF